MAAYGKHREIDWIRSLLFGAVVLVLVVLFLEAFFYPGAGSYVPYWEQASTWVSWLGATLVVAAAIVAISKWHAPTAVAENNKWPLTDSKRYVLSPSYFPAKRSIEFDKEIAQLPPERREQIRTQATGFPGTNATGQAIVTSVRIFGGGRLGQKEGRRDWPGKGPAVLEFGRWQSLEFHENVVYLYHLEPIDPLSLDPRELAKLVHDTQGRYEIGQTQTLMVGGMLDEVAEWVENSPDVRERVLRKLGLPGLMTAFKRQWRTEWGTPWKMTDIPDEGLTDMLTKFLEKRGALLEVLPHDAPDPAFWIKAYVGEKAQRIKAELRAEKADETAANYQNALYNDSRRAAGVYGGGIAPVSASDRDLAREVGRRRPMPRGEEFDYGHD